MERITHSLLQGSSEWHQFRSTHFGASEAAAMLGLSKYTSRAELLRAKATGAEKEISASLQTVFDRGHATESLARPLAEDIIEELLYPVTCSFGKLSASCDGLTMDGDIAFEHKQHNVELLHAITRNELPDEHQPQCQQVMLVTGATKLFFVCSDGTRDNFSGMWVHTDAAWQERIVAGWAQFDADLAAYQHVEHAATPIAIPIRDLPAIRYQLNGLALTSNLSEFREAALVLVEDSKRELTTDQDFADTDARNKAFKVAEDKIELMAAQVLAEIEDVDKFTRDLKDVGALIRQARLNGEKKVTARKDAIKGEIVDAGQKAIVVHIEGLNKCIGKPYMPAITYSFQNAVKGKRTIASLHDAVDTELARAKIAANEIADRIQINLKALNAVSGEFPQLFPDAAAIVTKPLEDFNNLVNGRVQTYKDAEAKRIEAARIAAEIKAQLEEQAKARKVQADAIAAMNTPTVASLEKIFTGMGVEPNRPAVATIQKAQSNPADVYRLLKDAVSDFTAAELTEVLNAAIVVKTRRQEAA